MMQLPGAMRPPTHGEKSAYYFSLEQALEARELFHPINLAENVHPADVWGRLWSAGVATGINPVAVRTRPSCP